MALKIGISSYVSGGYTNPVAWRLYETGSGTLVDEHMEMGPHGVTYNFDFVNNIRDIVYTVRMYEVPGGTGIGVLIKAEDVTVTTSTITADSDIETVVDNGGEYDPVSTTSTSIPIPALVGKDFYVVQRSIGQRRVDVIPEITINNDGSYSLLGGEEFNPEDTWIIKIRAQYVINPPGSQGIGAYRDVVLITTDYTVLSSDFGKLLIVDGMATVITVQLPVIADIISKLSIWIRSIGTNHVNLVIKAATGETITATGTTSNTFVLGRATDAEVINLAGTLYGFTDDADIRKVGQLEWGYYQGLNRLIADGIEYNVADYPRLKKAIDQMPVGEVVTYTQWNSNQTVDYIVADDQSGNDQVIATKVVYPYKGYFALSDDGTKFKVPDLRNRFIRALSNTSDSTPDPFRVTQLAGGYQVDSFTKHSHNVDTSQGEDGVGKFTTGNNADEPEVVYTKATGNSETRGENVGMFPLIII
jgi:hypothetical protein